VNDYIRYNKINSQHFFQKHNNIRNSKFAYIFEFSEGLHCVACKRHARLYDCVYICGLSKPTGQRDRTGKYNQFVKCKFYTNNKDHIIHNCRGVVNDHMVYEFSSRDSRSYKTKSLVNDFDEFDDVINYINNYNNHHF